MVKIYINCNDFKDLLKKDTKSLLKKVRYRKRYLRRVVLASHVTNAKVAAKYYNEKYNAVKTKEKRLKLALNCIKKL